MIVGSVSKRYARALFLIGEERRALEQITSEMESLAASWSASSELRHVVQNPLFPIGKRRDILRAIVGKLGLGEIASNAAMLLLDRSRLGVLPDIAKALRALADEREGKIRAEVVSAVPLPAPYVDRLRTRLEKMTGRRVVLDQRHDPSLIAGLVARVGDRLYDGSARTRLADIRESLMES